MNRWIRVGYVAAFLPLAACNSNPAMPFASTVPTPQTMPSISAQDQKFMDQATSANIFEIKSAQLALQRSRNPRTRRYAQMIVQDHTAAGQQLAALAQANGVMLPTDMGPEQQRAYAAIENTQRIFDSEFFRQQALAHQTTITVFQDEVANGYNNDVKQFAQAQIPILQRHLDMAQAGRQMPMGRVPARPAVQSQ